MPPILETARLVIRPFVPADADAAYSVFEGHPDVWRFDPGFQRTREQRRALIEKYAQTNGLDGVGTLSVTLHQRAQLIGYIGHLRKLGTGRDGNYHQSSALR